MAKASRFGSDTELNKHMKQPGLYAHNGADYFIARRKFYDESLSPRFNALNLAGSLTVDGDVTLGSDLYLPNDAKIYFRNAGDTSDVKALSLNTSDDMVLGGASGQRIYLQIGGTNFWNIEPTGALVGSTNITTWASILTDKDAINDTWGLGVHSDTASHRGNLRLEKSRGSSASPSYVQADDYLGDIIWYSYNYASSPAYAASLIIRGLCDVTPTSGSDYVEGRLEILTCHDETASVTRKLSIIGEQVQIGDGNAVYSDLTRGLIIDQGGYADGILVLASSNDVAHGCTSYASTDVFGLFLKQGDASGGLELQTFTESYIGFDVKAFVTSMGTGKNASSTSVAHMRSVYKISGTGITNVDANSNLWALRCYLSGANRTVAIFDAEGTLHLDDTIASDAWDEYDDIVLARDLSRVLAKKWGETLKYNVMDMHNAGLLTYTPYGDGRKPDVFLNMKNLVKFGFCTIMQIGEKLQAYEDRIAQLEAKLLEA